MATAESMAIMPKKDAETVCRGITFKDFRAWEIRGGGSALFESSGYTFNKKGKKFTFSYRTLVPQEVKYVQIILDREWYLEVGTIAKTYHIPLGTYTE